METSHIFSKDIKRKPDWYIDIDQAEEVDNKFKIEEYVFTTEAIKNFRVFFNSYKKGILEDIDINCIWISGDEGSGKSHFLNTISFIIENRRIDNKAVLEYITENNKIRDSILISDMMLASYAQADIIKLNINNKYNIGNQMKGKSFSEILTEEFNKTLDGYFIFEGDLGEDTDIDTNNEMISNEEKLAITVNNFLSSKPSNHKIVFLIDDIDLYIEDNVDQICNLNLTIEKLSEICKNKIYFVATGRKDLKTLLSEHDIDFKESRIDNLIYRFNTNILINGSDMEKLIRERMLRKSENGRINLKNYYKENSAYINKLLFTNKENGEYNYITEEQFVENYPFVPEQFNLIFKIIKSMEDKGILNNSFSYTPRTFMSLFQKMILSEIDDMQIISLNRIYNPLNDLFIREKEDSIINALDNKKLNEFDLEVFKTLFLIKQINPLGIDIENLITMMITSLEQDRDEIKTKVENSLKLLYQEKYIDLINNKYIYLTSEELEIYQYMMETPTQKEEISQYISQIVFSKHLTNLEYDYKSRFTIKYNKILDSYHYMKDEQNLFNLIILTPFAASYSIVDLEELLSQKNSIIIKMPEDELFTENVENIVKINKFINYEEFANNQIMKDYCALKEEELYKLSVELSGKLYNLLEKSDIYVSGERQDFLDLNLDKRIEYAFEKVANISYYKMAYVETEPSETDIKYLLGDNDLNIDFQSMPNQRALKEILDFLTIESNDDKKIQIKKVIDKFTLPPYGFLRNDILWLIAVLFRRNEIRFLVLNEPILNMASYFEEITDPFIDWYEIENIQIELQEKVNGLQIRIVRRLYKELFEIESVYNEDILLMLDFINKGIILVDKLYLILQNHHNLEPRNIGRKTIEKYINLFNDIKSFNDALEFYKLIQEREYEFLEDKEDLKKIIKLYDSDKKEILYKTFRIIDDAKENNIVFDEINDILEKLTVNPINNLDLLELSIETYENQYKNLIQEELDSLVKEISIEKGEIILKLEEHNIKDDLFKESKRKFFDLLDSIKDLKTIDDINNKRLELNELTTKCIEDIENYISYESNYEPTWKLNHEQSIESSYETSLNSNKLEHGLSDESDYKLYDELKHETINLHTTVKKYHHISIDKIIGDSEIIIQNEMDIENFLEHLREVIVSEKSNADILYIK